MPEEIEDELKKILGDDAYSIGDMQVSENVQKLVKSVNYIVTQLKITGKWIEDEDGKEYIKKIISNVKEFLSK